WLSNNPALFLSIVATSECSGPNNFSRMACDRSYSGSASVYLPWALNNSARLLRDLATSECSGPSTFSRMACDRPYSGSASVYLP
ncbi:unnamed protein product, partial [Ectocarpus sp. 13 AM-2016]